MSPIRLAVCDDHPVFRAGVISVLATEPDLEVCVEAGTAAELEAKLGEQRVDVVLLDVELSGVSGLSLLPVLARVSRVLIFSAYDKRGVKVTVRGNCNLVPTGDPGKAHRLAQGVFNVIENAISAAKREVDVHLHATPTHVDIAISDDGPGMEEQWLQRATQPFVTSKRDGMGMGLAIALAAARLWEGDLLVENRSGVGLKVVFQLPRFSVAPIRRETMRDRDERDKRHRSGADETGDSSSG